MCVQAILAVSLDDLDLAVVGERIAKRVHERGKKHVDKARP